MQTKLFAQFEKLLTPHTLLALNIAIILAAEFVGGGRFFAETGIVHAIAIIFVGLTMVSIFSDYAFSDHILKGFLKIQLAFFLFLGLVHIYEYVGLHIFILNETVVEQSVVISYLIWVIGVLWALEFVFRVYYKKSAVIIVLLCALLATGVLCLIGVNVSGVFAQSLPEWFYPLLLASIIVFGIIGILSVGKIKKIMPVFGEYARYANPAMAILVIAAFFEYFESANFLSAFGISDTQNLYLAHFLIYAVLSLLFIGFGKLKNPTGIYAEM